MATTEYDILSGSRSSNGIKYFFVSKGRTDIIKAVDYSYIQDYNGKAVFNLGFGDFDLNANQIDDGILTGNRDTYKVLNTVLSTVPLFFESFSHSIMIVRGSDSSNKYEEDCRINCKRNCSGNCRKANRRIKIYCNYVNKNFEELDREYSFYGGFINDENKIVIENYVREKKYKAVLVLKK